jgi:hypothetical protein
VTRFAGDEVLPGAQLVMDRDLTLGAPPADVWPWLEQLGKDRAGWYLPRSVERFVPRSRRATRSLDERWLGLELGDQIPDWGPGKPHFELIARLEPRHLVYWSQRPRGPRCGGQRQPLRVTWALVLSPVDGGRTHLHLRLRADLGRRPGPLTRYGGGAIDLATVWLMGRGLDERLRSDEAS